MKKLLVFAVSFVMCLSNLSYVNAQSTNDTNTNYLQKAIEFQRQSSDNDTYRNLSLDELAQKIQESEIYSKLLEPYSRTLTKEEIDNLDHIEDIPLLCDIAPYLNITTVALNNATDIASDFLQDSVLMDDVISLSNGYGTTTAYKQENRRTINCYGYAIGIQDFLNPGDIYYPNGGAYNNSTDVETASEYVILDYHQEFGKSACRVAYQSLSVHWCDCRICMRVGDFQYIDNYGRLRTIHDFHFMRQTNTGCWCQKHGQQPSENNYNIDPDSDSNWYLPGTNQYYQSLTNYIDLTTLDF